MIILDDRFLDNLDKYDSPQKVRIIDAIHKLKKEPKSGGPGIKKLKGQGYDHLWEYRIDQKLRLLFEWHDANYLIRLIWDKGRLPNHLKLKRGENDFSKAKPIEGAAFSLQDFETLKLAFKIPTQISEEEYHEKIREQIFPKFNVLGDRIPTRLREDLGIELYPHKAEKGDIGKDPVVWLAFTRSTDNHYENYSQLTFHLGIGDCIHETNKFFNHFCIKLAVFHDKPDTRRFWRNVEGRLDAVEIIKTYARKLDSRHKMSFYRKKSEPPTEYPAHTNDEEYLNMIADLMRPESISKGFFGFSFSRNYDYSDRVVAERFSNIDWVENEIVSQFSDLMYLYFMFSEDDPFSRIKEYEKIKNRFDERKR